MPTRVQSFTSYDVINATNASRLHTNNVLNKLWRATTWQQMVQT